MQIDDKIKNKIKDQGFDEFFCTKLIKELEILAQLSLDEDLDQIGDITSNAILNNSEQAAAKIFAKQQGIFSGGFIIEKIFKQIDSSLSVIISVKDGEKVKPGQIVAKISGDTKSILMGERTVLNFISRTSGISTCTNEFVNKVNQLKIKILDTRKTIPGWRYLDKYAVRLGGATNHRIGLFDMFLIKENHIVAASGLKKAVNACRNYNRAHNLKAKIETETRNLKEINESLEAKVDRIMLDNMNIQQIKEAIKLIAGKTEIEISGGINLENVDSIVDINVDYVSIGKLTHSAQSFDFSLLME